MHIVLRGIARVYKYKNIYTHSVDLACAAGVIISENISGGMATISDDNGNRSVTEVGENGFLALYERHRAGVFRIALHYARSAQDAEDILQETFIKAFKGIARFRESGNPNAEAWINRICFHRCIEHLRRQKRRRTEHTDFSEFDGRFGVDEPGLEKSAEISQLMVKVHQSLDYLSPRQRIVFDLRYFGECDIPDIARSLGCSESAVKTNLARAVSKLRGNLAPIMEEL
jgi:RNA polymerase sigma-70 factor, ECF subfamily